MSVAGEHPSPRLAGRTALVTGAATGIGRAVADRFAAEGARVVYADRNSTGAIDAAGGHADRRAVTMDISDERSVEEAFAELGDQWAPDVVVANAGVQLFGHDARIADLELDTWRRTLDVNLTGTFLTVKHAVRSMLRSGGGSIIVTGSPTALNGEGADFTAYSASKAGGHGLARAVAAAYAEHGIRVNVVVPGYTETTLVTAISDDADSRAAIVGRIPLGRPGTPRDVEGIMVFLASDDASFATGATFTVDGGMTTL
ncbi:NAD(P)-dependent dehydrogenase (short-subunit alcohol dehydrogenase family) [Diaminobutyricimonas aerilata]|uniref:NAD(P)-dependent dehydrogenase (Short-subunit alcohol dehydrogenase family) n=1 Tax=Diaminobutyricimonas aerilata TaxID=1162967 RepID=A0A2M9CFC5_9MICO|nr:SDR family NAD(P)-dependent oxidoreductase [Diaminobutyricimonas aerilata]PJJ70644.1 NAD(P)-dependent dehydrogenase (short-subunit alcohol dehydrogenase family) [Diaminobutyricimonas aerilata]